MDGSFPKRKALRLKSFDYSSEGFYFVTICTQDRQCLFGAVVGAGPGAGPQMVLNDAGYMVKSIWNEMPDYYPGVYIDEFVVMPNHVHGIISIDNRMGRGAVPAPEHAGGETPPLQPALGRMVAYFKYQSTKRINEVRETPGESVWQRNYYEHVIRNESDLNQIRQYILDNPGNWASDAENVNAEMSLRGSRCPI